MDKLEQAEKPLNSASSQSRGQARFSISNALTRIGKGSLGGKALGLMSLFPVLPTVFPDDPTEQILVRIPHMIVAATACFDDFMKQNRLYDLDFDNLSDDRIAHKFQQSSLPAEIVGDLRAAASELRRPIAVRSSSLLEDSMRRPCAGIYLTKMIPNNEMSPDNRFSKLVGAIKFVYASMFFKKAREYRSAFNSEIGDEKMAVLIQEVVGNIHRERFYPMISGTARSYNYYPHGHAKSNDGTVSLAVGLGKTVVDGGIAFTYCPRYPKSPPPYNGISSMIKETQTEFYAVNVGALTFYNPIRENEFLIKLSISEAERDGVLNHTASTYNSENDRLVSGITIDGPRIIDFAPILQLNSIPLNQTILKILKTCENTIGTNVEIEFAVESDRSSNRTVFNLLQVRPTPLWERVAELSEEDMRAPNVIIASDKVLGNGIVEGIRDIVYVEAEALDPHSGATAAQDLAHINHELYSLRRPYILIAYGRMGSSDPWRGIPVAWSQISGAKVIIEIQKKGFASELSQGSHFFHNMTSSETSCFSVMENGLYGIDWNYIKKQEVLTKHNHVNHVRSSTALTASVDGQSKRGIVTY